MGASMLGPFRTAKAMHHLLLNAGFLTFSQFWQSPLQYALPRRFNAMPSTPSSHAFSNRARRRPRGPH